MSPRSRASARAAGSRFERTIADYLALHVDDRIDRRVKTGAKDRGDVGGVRILGGGRAVIECKDVATLSLGQWVREAEVERGNDDAAVGVVVHKRRGVGHPGLQYVTCTVDDLVALLTGTRPAPVGFSPDAADAMPGTVPLPLPEFADNPENEETP